MKQYDFTAFCDVFSRKVILSISKINHYLSNSCYLQRREKCFISVDCSEKGFIGKGTTEKETRSLTRVKGNRDPLKRYIALE